MDYPRLGTGYRLVWDQFQRHRPVHAYLLTGSKGLGKLTFAKALACMLFCTAERKPCGQCEGCRRVLDDSEPRVLTAFPQEGKQIPIDRIREIISEIGKQTQETRVVLIEPVEKMSPQAQNALLKSLEEPVSNVVFLLMAHESTAPLGTIASRCCRVKLVPWPDEVMRSTLNRLGYSGDDAERAIAESSGNIGQALSILQSGEKEQALEAWVQQALSIRTDADAAALSTKIKDDREGAERTLDALEQAMARVLMARTGRLRADQLDAPAEWRGIAENAPVSELTALMNAFFEARKYRAGQVNWQADIDRLLIKILEAKTRWQQ
ncbi:MAG: AAA family ATPase [Eubacteriales bacterium]|nr:AAA family ATPase [Eubacteriales bacterium]